MSLRTMFSVITLIAALITTPKLIDTKLVATAATLEQQQQQQQPSPLQTQHRLPFCNDASNRADSNAGHLYVSTLDGRITALDILDGGKKKWSLSTKPGQMISSSIHNLELTNNGQWVRMIPSLSGSLYKFDGETVEPIPINADNLLSSSFKFSDDLVISGGKETITYGVSAHNGRIIYECSMNNCTNGIDSSHLSSNGIDEEENRTTTDNDVIIVRRQTQTVRAIEPRTGGERWNFSVGQHDLELVPALNDCHSGASTGTAQDTLSNIEFKVIVPEGVICAVDKVSHDILWKHKFDHPVVNAWRRDEQKRLKAIDLFQTAATMWQQEQSWANVGSNNNNDQAIVPSIYIGMYNKQLYIQESEKARLEQVKAIEQLVENPTETFARIPWQPVLVSSSALIQTEQAANDEKYATKLITDSKMAEKTELAENHMGTAISVLYATEYINGNGFYLYSRTKATKSTRGALEENGSASNESTCGKDNETSGNEGSNEITSGDDMLELGDSDELPKINVVSLWYWWKEIMVIALTTALIVNVMQSQRKFIKPEVVIIERHVEIKVPATPESQPEYPLLLLEHHPQRSLSESHTADVEMESTYKSRFQTDFDMLQCLGKGGFGVVFEVKNKLDDCNYAIKRIVLPKSEKSRERVMREVKTLANCEHQNIVRYFQAWVEAPPPGWQEKEDQSWMRKDAMSHSIDMDSPSVETSPPYSSRPHKLKFKNQEWVQSEVFNHVKLNSVISGLHTNECVNFDDVIRKTNFSVTNNDDDDDDSFIQFKADDDIDDEDSDLKCTDKCDDLSNSVFSSDSYSGIQFCYKGDSISCNRNKCSNEKHESNSSNKLLSKTRALLGRSSSLNNDSCIPVNGPSNRPSHVRNNDHITSNGLKKVWCHAAESSLTSNSIDIYGIPKKVPFKKTHRRPLSLDLTSSGSVVSKAAIAAATAATASAPVPRMYLYIQMQLCRKESLKDWLQDNDVLARESHSLSIFRQIVEAVEYVHLKGLIHRDLKPSNIFFSLDGQIKIGDFGLVTDMSDNPKAVTPCGDETGLPSCAKHTEQVGTHLYMSPEQLRGRQYNYKVDIYSLGLIFFELLVVFGTEMERIETLKSLRSSKFPSDFTSKYHHEYDLLKLMLSKSPGERPTTYGIRGRPPFSEKTEESYHFDLPPRRRDSHNFSSSYNSNSNSSSSVSLKMK